MAPIERFHKCVQWLIGLPNPSMGFRLLAEFERKSNFLKFLLVLMKREAPSQICLFSFTGARRYLSSDSCVPGYTFNGVVYCNTEHILGKVYCF